MKTRLSLVLTIALALLSAELVVHHHPPASVRAGEHAQPQVGPPGVPCPICKPIPPPTS